MLAPPIARAQITCPAPVGPGQSIGDVNVALAPSFSYFVTSVPLTTARTWILPLANQVTNFCQIVISDPIGAITSSNTLMLLANTNPYGVQDSINGTAFSVLNISRSSIILQSNGINKWTIIGGNGTLIVPQVANLAALQASITATYPSGVWRSSYSSGINAPPLFFMPESRTCALNGYINDGGSCVNTTSGDGNSFYAVWPSGLRDIREWGGKPDSGTTDNAPVLTACFASLTTNTGGGCYLPATSGGGKYGFNSQVSYSYPASQFSLTLQGDGADATILYWPNNSAGISLTENYGLNSFHIHGLAFTTPKVGAGASTVVTITDASPSVVTWSGHGLTSGTIVQFRTTSALPTPLLPGVNYYVVSPTANTFEVALSPGGTPINTSSSGSGTQTGLQAVSALSLVQTAVGNYAPSEIRDVSFHGDALANDYWTNAIVNTGVSNITIDNTAITCDVAASLHGTAVSQAGTPTITAEGLVIGNNTIINNCGDGGLVYGSYNQGATITNSAVLNSLNHYVYVPAGGTAIDGLLISSSNFGAGYTSGGSDIEIDTSVDDVQVSNSLFFVNEGASALNFGAPSASTAFTGNIVSGQGMSSTTGVSNSAAVASNTTENITGNNFVGLTVGINAGSSVTAGSIVASSNSYPSTTTALSGTLPGFSTQGAPLITGGTTGGATSAGATVYSGSSYANTTEVYVGIQMPVSCLLHNLTVFYNMPPGSGKTLTATLNESGSTTGLTTSATGSSGSVITDTTHSHLVSAGDYIDLALALQSGGTAQIVNWSVQCLSNF
jgi:hypothetical protein